MIIDYSSTSFGDIPIKHSSELEGSPCIFLNRGLRKVMKFRKKKKLPDKNVFFHVMFRHDNGSK